MSQSIARAEMQSGVVPASEPASSEAVEELGPGDVQHLRGSSMKNPDSAYFARQHLNWPESELTPEELLRQAERSISDLILGSMPDPQGAVPHVDPVAQPTYIVTTNIGPATKSAQTTHTQTVEPASRGGLTLDDLGDVELDIAIELGRSELLIDEVMKLREGSVVTLDKLAGDPVDIIANGRLIARGELLVIDGMFGVRLIEVL